MKRCGKNLGKFVLSVGLALLGTSRSWSFIGLRVTRFEREVVQ